jgi:16S rRNA (adenine1518-N6/adenine1519-N6)-dimethyltransferase
LQTAHFSYRQQGYRPKRSLGQNFLRDDNIARKIVLSVSPRPDDTVVEIGPGEGALTQYLAPAVRRLILVELDDRAAEALRTQYVGERVTVLHADILASDLTAMAREAGRALRVVGNIPYNITSPILFHLLEHRAAVEDATIMMQKEVAQRLVASPRTKEYGILSVFFQLFTEPHLLFDVQPTAFYPRPSVVSSLVHLRILPVPRYPVLDETLFRAMVRSVFGTRRKMLRHSLREFLARRGRALPEALRLQQRPEELTVEELVRLGNDLRKAEGGGETA